MDKNKEIIKHRARQSILKKEVKSIKNRVPKILVFLAVLTALGVYYLEGRLYTYFGSGSNFVKAIIFLFIVVSLIYTYTSIKKVKFKEKELKQINSKLYTLMKLDVKDKND